jgi:hypothetical protein
MKKKFHKNEEFIFFNLKMASNTTTRGKDLTIFSSYFYLIFQTVQGSEVTYCHLTIIICEGVPYYNIFRSF